MLNTVLEVLPTLLLMGATYWWVGPPSPSTGAAAASEARSDSLTGFVLQRLARCGSGTACCVVASTTCSCFAQPGPCFYDACRPASTYKHHAKHPRRLISRQMRQMTGGFPGMGSRGGKPGQKGMGGPGGFFNMVGVLRGLGGGGGS